jgi:hypothetical protein
VLDSHRTRTLFGTAQTPRPSPESLPATAEWKVVYLWDKEFLD